MVCRRVQVLTCHSRRLGVIILKINRRSSLISPRSSRRPSHVAAATSQCSSCCRSRRLLCGPYRLVATVFRRSCAADAHRVAGYRRSSSRGTCRCLSVAYAHGVAGCRRSSSRGTCRCPSVAPPAVAVSVLRSCLSARSRRSRVVGMHRCDHQSSHRTMLRDGPSHLSHMLSSRLSQGVCQSPCFRRGRHSRRWVALVALGFVASCRYADASVSCAHASSHARRSRRKSWLSARRVPCPSRLQKKGNRRPPLQSNPVLASCRPSLSHPHPVRCPSTRLVAAVAVHTHPSALVVGPNVCRLCVPTHHGSSVLPSLPADTPQGLSQHQWISWVACLSKTAPRRGIRTSVAFAHGTAGHRNDPVAWPLLRRSPPFFIAQCFGRRRVLAARRPWTVALAAHAQRVLGLRRPRRTTSSCIVDRRIDILPTGGARRCRCAPGACPSFWSYICRSRRYK